MSSVDNEMARLQARQESLEHAFAINQGRMEEIMAWLDKDRCEEEEEKRGSFTLQWVNVARFSIKENICQHILSELSEALEVLDFCDM